MNLFFDFKTQLLLPAPTLEFYGLKIDQYIPDGFNFVCNTNKNSTIERWYYENIVESIMYDTHSSWLYLLVVNYYIFKIGESANPLGVRGKLSQLQPNTGSRSRIGRYSTGDSTDLYIRTLAQPYIDAGHRVEFWAKKCEIIPSTTKILGEDTDIDHVSQKLQELIYLDRFKQEVKMFPAWNKYRK
jgi:hypothetical protein